jgi:RNA recognition motif-containing protein
MRESFAQCGTVESATVVTDRFSDRPAGFGFVEMSTQTATQEAIAKLNDKQSEGRRLTVSVANSPGQPSGGGGGGRATPRW